MERISVIVSTANHAYHARTALDSVTNAITYLNAQPDSRDVEAELIVVDDASDDGTRALLEEYARGRPDLHLVLRGQASNPACVRNFGVTLSSGDPIFFLDGDDLFLENHLHECFRILRSQPDFDFVKTQVSLS